MLLTRSRDEERSKVDDTLTNTCVSGVIPLDEWASTAFSRSSLSLREEMKSNILMAAEKFCLTIAEKNGVCPNAFFRQSCKKIGTSLYLLNTCT